MDSLNLKIHYLDKIIKFNITLCDRISIIFDYINDDDIIIIYKNLILASKFNKHLKLNKLLYNVGIDEINDDVYIYKFKFNNLLCSIFNKKCFNLNQNELDYISNIKSLLLLSYMLSFNGYIYNDIMLKLALLNFIF